MTARLVTHLQVELDKLNMFKWNKYTLLTSAVLFATRWFHLELVLSLGGRTTAVQ